MQSQQFQIGYTGLLLDYLTPWGTFPVELLWTRRTLRASWIPGASGWGRCLISLRGLAEHGCARNCRGGEPQTQTETEEESQCSPYLYALGPKKHHEVDSCQLRVPFRIYGIGDVLGFIHIRISPLLPIWPTVVGVEVWTFEVDAQWLLLNSLAEPQIFHAKPWALNPQTIQPLWLYEQPSNLLFSGSVSTRVS